MKSVRTVLGLLLCLTTATIQGVMAQRSFTIEDYMKMKWVTSAQISPDGSRVLYTVVESDVASNQQLQSIWVVNVKGGAPLRLIEGIPYAFGSSEPLWSPDGKQIAFVSSREGGNQIWLLKSSGGKAIKLTQQPMDVQGFAWSPDGQRIAFIATKTGALPPEPQVVGQEAAGGGPQLYLVNAETAGGNQLTRGDLYPTDASWSPDGEQIAFTAHDDLYIVDVEGGRTRSVVERPGIDRFPRWSPDGNKIA